jgi:hypothetical protein
MKRIEAEAGEPIDQFFQRAIRINTGEPVVLVFNDREIEIPDTKTAEELICYLLYRIYFHMGACPLASRCPVRP